MSTYDDPCTYVLDPDDPETWGGDETDRCQIPDENWNENGIWECPHPASEGKQLCIFHLPPDDKTNTEVTDALQAVVSSVEDRGRDERPAVSRQFFGARFDVLDLSAVTFDTTSDCGLDFSYSSIDSLLRGRGTAFCSFRLNFRGNEIGSVDFCNAELPSGVSFDEAEIDGVADFADARFDEYVGFNWTVFGGRAIFTRAQFGGDVSFSRAEFSCTDGAPYWRGGDNDFRYATFEAQTYLTATTFLGDTAFENAEFRGVAHFYGGAMDEEKTVFEGKVGFDDTAFESAADFDELHLDDASFEAADLTDASFVGASLRRVNFESALLNRATLFGADLRGARLFGAMVGDVRVDDQTRFLSVPSNDTRFRHDISRVLSRPCCVYDPRFKDGEDANIDKAKSVYRALEELGGRVARPRLQSQSFVRRQSLQKKEYWDCALDSSFSLGERSVMWSRWIRAKTAELTILYGESPWRIVGFSLFTIIGFGLVYPLGGWLTTSSAAGVTETVTYYRIAGEPLLLWKSLYHSAMLFATGNSYGSVYASGLTGELLTTAEALLGPTLLALLVFVLGRRAAR